MNIEEVSSIPDPSIVKSALIILFIDNIKKSNVKKVVIKDDVIIQLSNYEFKSNCLCEFSRLITRKQMVSSIKASTLKIFILFIFFKDLCLTVLLIYFFICITLVRDLYWLLYFSTL